MFSVTAKNAMLNGLLSQLSFGYLQLLENGVVLSTLAITSPAGLVENGYLIFKQFEGIALKSGKPNQVLLFNSQNEKLIDCGSNFLLEPMTIQAGGVIMIDLAEIHY